MMVVILELIGYDKQTKSKDPINYVMYELTLKESFDFWG